MKKLLSGSLAAVSFLLLSVAVMSQDRYTVRTDPSNPKRKIVELKPVSYRLNLTQGIKNILDEDKAMRKPIPFQPFEMKHPKTGKPLNPDAKMNIKMPDGSTRSTTVKEFYAQVNELEKQLSAKGRSLRQPNTLTDLKAPVPMSAYNSAPFMSKGFNGSAINKNPTLIKVAPLNNTTLKINMPNVNVMKPVQNMDKIIPLVMEWQPHLYIAESTSGYGTTEFPATWVEHTIINAGRKEYPILVGVPKGFSPVIKKIVWQVSPQPFDNTLKDVNVPGIKKQGEIGPAALKWTQGVRGAEDIAYKTKDIFATFIISLADIPYPATDQVSQYYVRTILYSETGDVIRITPQVTLKYGHVDVPIKVPYSEYNTVPGFNYSFPPESSDMPFGMYIKGGGLSSVKRHDYTGPKFSQAITAGYRLEARAKLGIKYFNFSSIVNSSEPRSKDFDLIDARFKAVAGTGTSPTMQNEPQGISLTLNVLNGIVPPIEYGFTEKIPGTDAISLEYKFNQSLDADLLDTRFMIGPIPIRITAGIFGDAGVAISGKFDQTANNYGASGEIRPYINTGFRASGGVDAVIAYATLNAEVNPLLSLNMPLTFQSNAEKPLTFSTNVSGLKGRVYLKAGFYYPCPSLEKIVGFLTGDEDLPLCECSWEYNIFSFDGFEQKLGY